MAIASSSSRSQSSSSRSYSSPFASSSATNFSLGASSPLMTRSSTAKLTLHRQSPSSAPSPTKSVRLSVDQRSASPVRRSMTVTTKKQRSNENNAVSSRPKKTCMCSPTTHAGSFRCSYHKQLAEQQQQQQQQQPQTASSRGSSKLNLRRSAMKNSLVRIGGVEGELARRTLTTLIRPSSNQLRRREDFQARPSRLSVMSDAQDS